MSLFDVFDENLEYSVFHRLNYAIWPSSSGSEVFDFGAGLDSPYGVELFSTIKRTEMPESSMSSSSGSSDSFRLHKYQTQRKTQKNSSGIFASFKSTFSPAPTTLQDTSSFDATMSTRTSTVVVPTTVGKSQPKPTTTSFARQSAAARPQPAVQPTNGAEPLSQVQSSRSAGGGTTKETGQINQSIINDDDNDDDDVSMVFIDDVTEHRGDPYKYYLPPGPPPARNFGFQVYWNYSREDGAANGGEMIKEAYKKTGIRDWSLYPVDNNDPNNTTWRLGFTNDVRYDYRFYDQTGDEYTIKTQSVGPHVILFESDVGVDPQILFVTGQEQIDLDLPQVELEHALQSEAPVNAAD